MFELILHPFALGLYVGVFFCIYIFFSEMARRRHLKLKIKELEEVDDLKKQNENMRITLATLQTKPGAAELKMLYTFDRAISIMNQRTPGFSGVWEGVMLEAQKEVEESTSGIRGLIRKVFKPSVMLSNAPVTEEKGLKMVEESGEKNE